MELQTGEPASRCKRRKSATLKGEEGGGVDRISNLPDDNLRHIISLLPTKDGARTQVLAPRWRHLWHSGRLYLDYRGLVATQDDDTLAQIVPRILAAHPGPGGRFCIPAHHLVGGRAAASDVWLRSPALDNLQELEFSHHLQFSYKEQLVPPPASAFRFSATLLAFTFGKGHLPDDITRALLFPLLKHLTLGRVRISDGSLDSLISGCPAIECLLINGSFGFSSININSLTLRTLGIKVRVRYGADEFKELVIENAPCLRRLLGLDFKYGLHLSVVSAPKLEVLGCFFQQDFPSTAIVFGSMVIQGLHVDSLTLAASTVKILAVHMASLSLDALIESLRFFPCLEKLYVMSLYLGPNNFWRRKHKNLITCLDIRLKTIVLDSYAGTKPQVNFATFFVLNAKVLESMTVIVLDSNYNNKFVELHRKKLQLENRASRGARIHFMAEQDCRIPNVLYIKDVHDVDVTDPFMR